MALVRARPCTASFSSPTRLPNGQGCDSNLSASRRHPLKSISRPFNRFSALDWPFPSDRDVPGSRARLVQPHHGLRESGGRECRFPSNNNSHVSLPSALWTLFQPARPRRRQPGQEAPRADSDVPSPKLAAFAFRHTPTPLSRATFGLLTYSPVVPNLSLPKPSKWVKRMPSTWPSSLSRPSVMRVCCADDALVAFP